MRKRKLYHLLSLMTAEDLYGFTEFLQCSYFNKSQTLLLFWEQWQRKMGKGNAQVVGDVMTPEVFVEGSALKASRVNRLCSDLYLQAKHFLSLERLESHTSLQDFLFASAVLDRDPGLEVFHRFIPPMLDELASSPESPEKYLGLIYNKAQLLIAQIGTRKAEQEWGNDFSDLQDLLRIYAESKSLQMACGAVNVNLIYRQEGDFPENRLYNQIETNGGASSLELLPRLFYLTLSLQLGKDTTGLFSDLLQLLRENRRQIEDSISNSIYSYLLNHCIRQANQGNEVFLQYAHELYLDLLENGDLFTNGKLPPGQFKNMVALGCRLEHLTWVEVFIREYLPLLSDLHEGMAEQFNLAVLSFHQGRLAGAIASFKGVIAAGEHDPFYGLDARIYLWKSYFEHLDHLAPEEVDDMHRLYDSFRLYIDRNKKISDLHRLQYRNFVRLFKSFVLILETEYGPTAATALHDFQAELAGFRDVANKTWFLQKVADAIERRG